MKRKQWSEKAQVAFAAFAATIASVLWIGLPIYGALPSGGAVDMNSAVPLFAVLVSMTTMSIAGIFLFMTFRIKGEARSAAEQTAKKVAKETAKNRIDKRVDRAARRAAKKAHDDAKPQIDGVVQRGQAWVDAAEQMTKSAGDAAVEANQAAADAANAAKDTRARIEAEIDATRSSVKQRAQDAQGAIADAEGAIEQVNVKVADAQDQVKGLREAIASIAAYAEDDRARAKAIVKELLREIHAETASRKRWLGGLSAWWASIRRS